MTYADGANLTADKTKDSVLTAADEIAFKDLVEKNTAAVEKGFIGEHNPLKDLLDDPDELVKTISRAALAESSTDRAAMIRAIVEVLAEDDAVDPFTADAILDAAKTALKADKGAIKTMVDKMRSTRLKRLIHEIRRGTGAAGAWVHGMNAKFVVLDGQIVRANDGADADTSDPIKLLTDRKFSMAFANKPIWTVNMHGKLVKMPMSSAWIQHELRRDATAVGLWPVGKAPDGALNLWKGLAIEPKAGKWDLTKEYLRDVLCNGDLGAYDYLENLLASWCQEPTVKGYVAILLMGPQGTGKTTLYRMLEMIFGRHASIHISDSHRVTGRFNTHLALKCVAMFDESMFGGDRSSRGAINNLISEDFMPIEGKGADVIPVRNYMHIVAASNEMKPVSMATDDRRWFVLETGKAWAQDTEKFAELHASWDNGELAAFLDHLLKKNLKGFDKRTPYVTEAKKDVSTNVANPIERFFIEALEAGTFPGTNDMTTPGLVAGSAKWETSQFTVNAKELRTAIADWASDNVESFESGKSSDTAVGHYAKRLTGVIKTRKGKDSFYTFMPIGDCRKVLGRARGWK